MLNFKKYIVLVSIFLTMFSSCEKEDTPEEHDTPNRTVLIYCSAENNLDSYLWSDINEMTKGANTIGKNNLLVFIDQQSSSQKPYLVRINEKGLKTVKEFSEDFFSSDPDRMSEIMKWTVENYRADSYGLAFWGHGDGSLLHSDTIRSNGSPAYNARKHAYGVDNGTDIQAGYSAWINIPTLAKVIEHSMPHLDFIFFDCCNMQSVEVAYELRNTCDYIIGAPSEIPGFGAPYETIVKDLFLPKQNVGKALADDYILGNESQFRSWDVNGVPLSVIYAPAMDNLALSTREALYKISSQTNYATAPLEVNTDDCTYYFKYSRYQLRDIMYDARHVFYTNLPAEDFRHWDEAFQQAVIYHRMPQDIRESKNYPWMTDSYININFYNFTISNAYCGAVSMFFPKTAYNSVTSPIVNPNRAIFNYSWSSVVDWHTFGW